MLIKHLADEGDPIRVLLNSISSLSAPSMDKYVSSLYSWSSRAGPAHDETIERLDASSVQCEYESSTPVNAISISASSLIWCNAAPTTGDRDEQMRQPVIYLSGAVQSCSRSSRSRSSRSMCVSSRRGSSEPAEETPRRGRA